MIEPGRQKGPISDGQIMARLLENGHRRAYAAGAIVFEQGEQANFFPTVITGRVKVFRFPSPGKEVIVNIFGPGDSFAFPPVLDGSVFPASAAAHEDSELLIINRENFLQLIDESKEFSDFVMSRMSSLL
ncbi:MAG: Crp/Fnr family transcriptional regulator [Pyrinomonadaceae bacterium]